MGRQMRTVAEVVESIRVHLSPAVAALVEAQLRMRDVSGFGRGWCNQNKALALGLFFMAQKAVSIVGDCLGCHQSDHSSCGFSVFH